MGRPPLTRNLLACALAGIAGYVDGIGYLHLSGAFVSFMSGNSTRLGVGAARLDWELVIESATIIGYFVAGAGLGVAQVLLANRHPGLERVDVDLRLPVLPVWLVIHEEVRRSARIRRVADFLGTALAGILAGA